MNTASGKTADETRWPPPVLAAPRGVREIAWHLCTVAAVTGAVRVQGGWIALPWVAVVSWILSPTPRQLARVSATYLVLGLAIAWGFGTRKVTDHLLASLLWTDPVAVTIVDGIIHFLLLIAVSTAVVASLLGYDRRRVNRRVVDHRVWERQALRRRQLMRRWAWGRQLPEVLP